MELFIRIVDGQPFEHPIFGENFRQAFPDIDVDNLPSEFARFERIEKPNTCGTFEVEESSYQWVDGIIKDVWTARSMTSEEETQKRNELTDKANAIVSIMKKVAQFNSEKTSNQEAKNAWIDFLTELNNWVLIDPTNPKIPSPPRISDDGSVLTNNLSGNTPNVIG